MSTRRGDCGAVESSDACVGMAHVEARLGTTRVGRVYDPSSRAQLGVSEIVLFFLTVSGHSRPK